MIINDKSGLLKPEEVDNAFDTLLEELDQTAAGPELEAGAELKDEATEKKEPETAVPSMDNKDVYSDEVHDQKEDVEGVVVKESDQLANGPELEKAGELKDEATVEKEPEAAEPKTDNKDVYCDHCHDQKEDVEGVVVKEDSVKEEEVEPSPEAEKAEEVFGSDDKDELELEVDDTEVGSAENTVSEVDSLTEEEDKSEEKDEESDELEKEDEEDKKDESEEKEDSDEEKEKEPVDEAMNSLFTLLKTINEETSQLANGPELEKAGELKDEATEKRAGEPAVKEVKNTDLYCSDCHDQKEDVEGIVVKESDQLAAGPEFEKADELKDEATVEKKPEVAAPEVDNKDVYCDHYHDQKEDVEGVVFKEELDYLCSLDDEEGDALLEYIAVEDPEFADALFEALDAAVNNETLNEGIIGNAVDAFRKARTEIGGVNRVRNAHISMRAQRAADKKQNKLDAKKQFKSNVNQKNLKDANDDIRMAKLAYKKAKITGKDINTRKTELKNAKNNRKQYTKNGIFKNKETTSKNQLHKNYEKDKAQIKKETQERKNQIDMNRISKDQAKADKYRSKAGLTEATDFEIMQWLNKNGYEPNMENVNILREADEETSQLANGPELEKAGELKDEATEKRNPDELKIDFKNTDIYTADVHKQVEDVVGVIVEAAARCKANGKRATMTNITEAIMAMFEAEEADPKALMGVGKEFADKEYDVDAAVESKEMNGGAEEKYEELQGEGASAALTAEVPTEVVHESVKYTSLKEACMLDEGYFAQDSYTKETVDAKAKKLTEQISLLMAREAGDPLYDELLKESIYCQRLQEQCFNKYAAQASTKANIIMKK